MEKKLNLGCGTDKLDGYVGVDSIKTAAVDIVHDLNIFPYPFEDNSVDEILMDNVLEHLEDVIKVMEELHRISKKDAIIRINVPHAKCTGALADPTHKHFFLESSFRYFEEDYEYSYYTKARFNVAEIRMINFNNDLKHKVRNIIPFKKMLSYFLFNMLDEIQFTLKTIK